MFPASILLVDDHPIFREALRALLNRESDLRVIAETSNRREAQALASAIQPGLAIVEAQLGSAAVRDIRAVSPATSVLVLADSFREDHVAEAFAAGAMGCALKTQRGTEVVAALRIIRGGQRYLAPGLAAPEIDRHGPARHAVRNGLLDG
jgi:DNA-binding NarL/FixJ family response regulator